MDKHSFLLGCLATIMGAWSAGNAAPAFRAPLFQASGACSGPADCNGRQCEDCSCDNGNCSCADGWSGPNCLTPFCTNRTQCSGHGNCHQTMTNISCLCDTGFTGPRCETSTCTLKCYHGGVANANCTACESCLGAWTGPTCQVYDTTANVSTLLAQLDSIYEAGVAAFQPPNNTLCRTGAECVGWGVDMFDLRLGQTPLVFLTFDPADPSTQFNKLLSPLGVGFSPVTNPTPVTDGNADGVFSQPSQFVEFVNNLVGVNSGVAGIYGSPWESILESYYMGPKDEVLSVVQAQLQLFTMELPTSVDVPLSRHFVEAIQFLPTTYEGVNATMWDRFFAQYGTNIVMKSSGGGILEQRSRWESMLSGSMSETELLNNAHIDFTTATGLGAHTGPLDPTYAANRVVEPGNSSGNYWCYGGDPATCAGADTTAWQTSVGANPVLVSFTATPISELLPLSNRTSGDPELKVAMEAAVVGYLAKRKAAWAAVNKCPPCATVGLQKWGSCAAPAEACTCGSCAVGRMCSSIPTTHTRPVNTTLTITSSLTPSPSVTRAQVEVGCLSSSVELPISDSFCTVGGQVEKAASKCITDTDGRLHVDAITLTPDSPFPTPTCEFQSNPVGHPSAGCGAGSNSTTTATGEKLLFFATTYTMTCEFPTFG